MQVFGVYSIKITPRAFHFLFKQRATHCGKCFSNDRSESKAIGYFSRGGSFTAHRGLVFLFFSLSLINHITEGELKLCERGSQYLKHLPGYESVEMTIRKKL